MVRAIHLSSIALLALLLLSNSQVTEQSPPADEFGTERGRSRVGSIASELADQQKNAGESKENGGDYNIDYKALYEQAKAEVARLQAALEKFTVSPLQRFPRSTETEPEEKCPVNGSCGWAVYKPGTRRIENYTRNTCTCPDGTHCIRTDDDLSIAAFVYRCRKIELQDTR